MNKSLNSVYVLFLLFMILLIDYSSPSSTLWSGNSNMKDHHHDYHHQHNNNFTVNKGIIVIPGLGRVDRLTIVVDNLKRIYSWDEDYSSSSSHNNSSSSSSSSRVHNGYHWDCIIYIYTSRESKSNFWNQIDDLQYLYTVCEVVEVPNKRVAENLHMLQPALIRNYYSRVFLLLDDCILTSSFELNRLLLIMDRNQLTVISPAVRAHTYMHT
jgi:hypothetical protein